MRQINPTRRIRLWYIVGLTTIATLTLLGQGLLHNLIGDQAGRANTINLAGRQRMLSQKITKAALANDVQELHHASENWRQSHVGLQSGDEELGLSGKNSEAIDALYLQLSPHYLAMSQAIDLLLNNPSPLQHEQAIASLLASEKRYLPLMNKIVYAYSDEGEAQVKLLTRAEYMLGGLTLIVLILEGLLIFEPMVRRLSRNWQKLLESERRFSVAVNGSKDAIWDWNLEHDSIYFAPRFAEMVGVAKDTVGDSPNELLERICSQHLPRFNDELRDVISGRSQSLNVEIRINHNDGNDRWVLCRAAAHRNQEGEAVRLAGSLADITDLKRYQQELQCLAERDQLTGLANRKYLTDRLELAIAHVPRNPDEVFGVLFLDFDRFKTINDSLGHSVGDGLLISIAKRLEATLPDNALPARFGGDEFAILLRGGSEEILMDQCNALLQVLAEPHQVREHEIVSTASIGVVLCDPRYHSAEAMLRDADTAMYEAKSTGKARIVLFDTRMHHDAVTRQELEKDLRSPSIFQQLSLHYQPVISLADGTYKCFEALVRWTHPVQGNVPPDVFIPIAEECGAIVPIGDWIFQEASRQLRRWDLELGEPVASINVNVSRKQLLQSDFIRLLCGHARQHPDEARRLVLEITETAIMDDRVDVIPVLQTLSDAGYRLAMDDFGTGYSSLSCLHRFPIDILKVDRAFVLNMEERREFAAVFSAIVSLAQVLGLEVVAEGIDSQAQLVQLQTMDCGFGQGYLFAKPLDSEAATKFLLGEYAQGDDTIVPAA